MNEHSADLLGVDDFARYFRDIHHHDPFPWQQRLTAEVLEQGRWPDVIDLPTGTGKTAVLDTAVFTLASRPDLFPRRVVFVIDRRIVVDQVVERAANIQKALEIGSTPVLDRVRSRLRRISHGSLLGVTALRGGIPIDGEWARQPDEPWVVVSTVDQFGSRLLFRGYGVSPKMRPIHAGLAGNDCLVILDEVHLSKPFAQTLREMAQYRPPVTGVPRRYQLVEMSATPTNSEGHKFKLEDSDLEASEELRTRARASKSAVVREAAGTKQPHEAVPAEVKKILKSELDPRARSVGVIVNRVRTARETYQALLDAGYSAHLITGRMRPLDRERSLGQISDLVDPDALMRPEGLTVVVSTQAIEVGADFSFDALITEVAPIDSLRQRFGRLDRRGTLAKQTGTPAKGWIVGVKSALNSRRPDPVYGYSHLRTWEELLKIGGFGPADFTPLQDDPLQFPEECYAPSDQAPLLLRSYMDAWAQTNPEPIVQPGIDWFLHGMESEQVADVTVVWRHDRSLEALREVPIRPAEYLQVPATAARAWLKGGEEAPVADVAGSSDDDRVDRDVVGQGSDWVRWQGHDENPERISTAEIGPGDVLVVDPNRGGLSGGSWDPSSREPVEDLGDEAQVAYDQVAYDQRATLRLDPRVLGSFLIGSAVLESMPQPKDESGAEVPLRERVRRWLEEALRLPDLPSWFSEVIAELVDDPRIKLVGSDSDNRESEYYILASKRVDASTIDGTDETASFTGARVPLREHLQGVGERAAAYAQRLGMSEGVQNDLRLAARLHDIGKVDPRFQLQMVGGDQVERAMLDEPLAKSIPGASPTRDRWPPIRHEIMSVALIQSNSEVLEEAHDPDLVMHLVETHHGHVRPLPPIVIDTDPHDLEYEHDGHHLKASTDLVDTSLALDMADRFWNLNARYGYHGLAWLEAILRLADHQQSAEEARR